MERGVRRAAGDQLGKRETVRCKMRRRAGSRKEGRKEGEPVPQPSGEIIGVSHGPSLQALELYSRHSLRSCSLARPRRPPSQQSVCQIVSQDGRRRRRRKLDGFSAVGSCVFPLSLSPIESPSIHGPEGGVGRLHLSFVILFRARLSRGGAR